MTSGVDVDTEELTLTDIEQFLYREARFADEHDYDAWEALWTTDGLYWIPGGGSSAEDPDTQMSIAYDNRSRIALRVAQLKSGKRHSQTPPSSVRRMISNVELTGTDGTDHLVGANFLAVESRERGTTLWAGRAEYRLRRVDGEIAMAFKKVILVDRDRALSTLAFLI
ncbi:MAG TPA: aromatic-ring-hydroxylating dioxygenase subunit beta [Pseudonocardia sp.]|nr:aromatic-ring-hydroxylating dioxygenase subunit beta [Pseudonocardia sp.]